MEHKFANAKTMTLLFSDMRTMLSKYMFPENGTKLKEENINLLYWGQV